MTPSTNVSKTDTLLANLRKIIAAQTAGTSSGFTGDELNHAYLSLSKGDVSESTADLLTQMLGADWADGWEPALTQGEKEDDVTNMAVAETLESIDITDPQDAVSTMGFALMMACRELGWLEASRAAHDQWFHSSFVTYRC